MHQQIKTLFVLFAFTFFTSVSIATPVLNNVASGSASFNQVDKTLTIQQNSQRAILNWHSFNIAGDEKTEFVQPNASAIALNRIDASQGASQIYGTLTANGKIILVNGAGIHFGPNAMVNVGGLIASTANITDEDFLNNKFIFTQSSLANGDIVNEGRIISADHGLVALVGSNINNKGYISANLGSVILATGSKFTFDFSGDQLINFTVDAPAQSGGSINNSGEVIANGGKVLVTARQAQGVLDNAINMSGVAVANSVHEQNGVIVLDGGNGKVRISGKVKARGLLGNKGGKVKVVAKEITVASGAELDVSGDTGGGEILVGGDAHGAGDIPHAHFNVVEQGANIYANAGTIGNGGKVVFWSDGQTAFNGFISAMGGSEGGNGGWAETSGHYLDVNGTVNLGANNAFGNAGQWLLDPAIVTISTNGGSGNTGPDAYTANSLISNVNVTNLVTSLASTNVTISSAYAGGGSGGSISVNTPISWNSAFSLTLDATGGGTDAVEGALNVNNAITNSGTGGITLKAGTSGGIWLNAGISVGNGSTTSGNITFDGPTYLRTDITLTVGNSGLAYFKNTLRAESWGLQGLTVTGNARFDNNVDAVGFLSVSRTGTAYSVQNNSISIITTTAQGASGNQSYQTLATRSDFGNPVTLDAQGTGAINIGSIDGGGHLALGSSLNLYAGGNSNITGSITNVSTGLNWRGPATVTLSGTNNNQGAATNNNINVFGGKLIVANANALPSGSLFIIISSASAADSSLELPNVALGASSTSLSFQLSSSSTGYAKLIFGTANFSNSIGFTGTNNILETSAGSISLTGSLTNGFAAGGFIKRGPYQLTINPTSNSNSYTGGTKIEQGMIIVSASKTSALGTSGAISLAPSVSSTAILDISALTSALTNTSQISMNSANGLTGLYLGTASTFANAINLTGTTNVNSLSVGGTTSLTGLINGSGKLWITGGGSLTFSNNSNSFSGGMEIGNNTVIVPASTPNALGSGAITIKGGSTLDLSFLNTVLSGASQITLDSSGGGNAQITYGSGTFAEAHSFNLLGTTNLFNVPGVLTLNGTVSGSGGFEKTGVGTLQISSAKSNTYTGGTIISNGILAITGSGTISPLSGPLGTPSGSFLAIAKTAGTLDIGTVTVNLNSNRIINFQGQGYNSLGALYSSGGNAFISNGTVTATVSTAAIGGPGNITFNTSLGAMAFNWSTIWDKVGAGNFTLDATSNGNNSANFRIFAGTVNYNTLSSLNGGGSTPTRLFNGGYLAYTGTGTPITDTSSFLTQASGGGFKVTQAGVTYNLSQSINTQGFDTIFDVASGSTLNITTIGVSGTSAGSFTKTGSGSLGLNVAEATTAFTGTWKFNGGTTTLNTASAINSANSNTIIMGGGTLDLKSNTALSVKSLSGTSGSITNTGSILTLTTNETGDVSYNGSIDGNLNFTKSGAGTLTLGGSNSYTGSTTISTGKLVANNAGAFGNTSGISVASSGAELQLKDFNFTGTPTLALNGGTGVSGNGALTAIGNSGTAVFNGLITLSANTTLGSNVGSTLQLTGGISNGGFETTFFANAGNIWEGGVISGTGGIRKTGNFYLTLAQAVPHTNTYSGGTTVDGGILVVDSPNSIGTPTGTNYLTLNNGSTLELYNNLSIPNGKIFTVAAGNIYVGWDHNNKNSTISAAGNGKINITNSLGLNVTYSDATLDISAPIDGSGNLVKGMPGTLKLSGNNTYTGSTTINTGILIANSAGAFGNGTNNTSGVTVVSGAELQLGNFDYGTPSTGLTLAGSGVSGNGALTGIGSSGETIFRGLITLTADTTIGTTGSSRLILTGGGLVNGGFLTTFNAVGGQLLEWGVISGTGGVRKIGSNLLGLSPSSPNTYSGGTTIDAGTLDSDGPNAFGTPTGTNYLTINSGTLILWGDYTIPNGKILTAAGGSITAGDGTIDSFNGSIAGSGTGKIVLTGNASFSGSFANVNLNLSALIEGAGSLTTIGPGTVILTANNTYTGATTISSGTLQIGNGGSVGSLGSNAGAITNNGVLTYNNTNNLTLSNAINGSGSVKLISNSVLTLNGSSNYSGGTTVNNGTIIAGNSAALGTGGISLIPNAFSTATLDLGTLTSLSTTGTITLNSSNISSSAVFQTNPGSFFPLTNPISIFGTNSILNIDGNSTTSMQGPISGSGKFIKKGTGILVSVSASNFFGDVDIVKGALVFEGFYNGFSFTPTPLPSGQFTIQPESVGQYAALQLNQGAVVGSNTFNLNSTNAPAYLTLFNNPVFTSANTITVTGTTNNNTLYAVGTIDLNQAITGSGMINFEGGGTFNLYNVSNNYAGGTKITAGTLKIFSEAALGTGGVTLYQRGTYSPTLDLSAVSFLTNNSQITLDSDVPFVNGMGVSTLKLGATTLANNISLVGRAVYFDVSGSSWVSGAISGQGIVKIGNGTLRLSNGSNTFTGLYIDTGVIKVTANGALASNYSITVDTDGTLDLENVTLNNNLLIKGSGYLNQGAITDATSQINGDITLNGDATIVVGAGDYLTLAGNINSDYNGSTGSYWKLFLAGAGEINLASPSSVGGIAPLSELVSTVGKLDINTAFIITSNTIGGGTGNQTYSTPTFAGDTTLSAVNININAPFTSFGTLNLNASGSINTAASTSGLQSTTGGVINAAKFNLLSGFWNQVAVADVLPSFTATDFRINSGNGDAGSNALFIRALSGDGSSGSPYLLMDIYGLQGMGSNTTSLTKYYSLNNDVDASSVSGWNNGAGFVPIGQGNGFSGNLNGFSHNIYNLYINHITGENTGLFAVINGAGIQNLALLGGQIVGAGKTGALAGTTNFASIDGVSSSVTVKGTYNVGGLVGSMQKGYVINSYASGDVYSNNVGIGGLVGGNDGNGLGGGLIQNSYSAGTIYIFGNNLYSIGGLVGSQGGTDGSTTAIRNSYSLSNIYLYGNDFSHVGGLVGDVWNSVNTGSISSSYSTGSINETGAATNVGGFVGRNQVAGSIVNSFWDTQTSGRVTGVGSGSSTGLTALTTQQSMNLTTVSGILGNTTGAASKTNVPTSSIWFVIDGKTRPILLSEVFQVNGSGVAIAGTTRPIINGHQLQLMNAALGASYSVGASFDLAQVLKNPNDVFGGAGSGFVPIGKGDSVQIDASYDTAFVGSFNGNYHVINGLSINTSLYEVGLFGAAAGSISNIGLTNVDIRNSGGASGTGGLVGALYADGSINNSYTTGNVFGAGAVGGLVGYTGTPDPYLDDGIVSISNSYSGTNVSGIKSSYLGGLVGILCNSCLNLFQTTSITNSYSYGNIFGANSINMGGFIGAANDGTSTITNSYSSGALSGSASFMGGFVGFNGGALTMTNSFWDTQTGGLNSTLASVGNNNFSGITGYTTAQMKTFGNFSSAWGTTAGTVGSPAGITAATTTNPNTFVWYMVDGNTRPFLMMEGFSGNSPLPIVNAHQLQLMNANMSGTYVLGSDIDLSGTQNVADIWGTRPGGVGGFSPIGVDTISGVNFSGNLDGKNYKISNLYIYRPASNYQGLFGITSTFSPIIKNLGLENVNVTGYNSVGGLVGNGTGSLIQNVWVSGKVTSLNHWTGGIAGVSSFISISNVANFANINGGGDSTGGIVGHSNITSITNSYNTGAITGTNISGFFNGNSIYVGGLVGYMAGGVISNSYSTGRVSGGVLHLGGLVGGIQNSNALVKNSFWDTDTSGQNAAYGINIGTVTNVVGGCFTGSCVNGGTANLSALGTYSGWDITGTVKATGAAPSNAWFIFGSGTRPMLMMEYNNNISTPHQLQLAGTALSVNYKLTQNIDLTSAMNNAADVWGTSQSAANGLGFVSFGNVNTNFLGVFDGANFAINGFYQSASFALSATSPGAGLFSYNGGMIKNLGLTNININFFNGAQTEGSGGLVGTNSDGIVTNSYVTGDINYSGVGTSMRIGGLVGTNGGAIGGAITNSYSNVNINANISNFNQLGYFVIGGLVGSNFANIISNSYSIGNINATASNATLFYVGGFAGESFSTIKNSYSTGKVTTTSINNQTAVSGGFLGAIGGANINNFWDIATSGQVNAGNNGAVSGVTGGTFNGTAAGSLAAAATYSAWGADISSTPSSSLAGPNSTWFIFDGASRPMLMMEYNTNISNAHQLQLMGAALNGNYKLANNIDLTSAMNNASDVWGTKASASTGAGFVPIGKYVLLSGAANPAFEFSGNFNGQNYIINNLYINSASTNSNGISGLGLFGATIGATIQNVGLTNISISESSSNVGAIGGLAGYIDWQAGSRVGVIYNTYTTGAITTTGINNNAIGGLVGHLGNSSVSNSYSSVNVATPLASSYNVGGLVGILDAGINTIISNSYSIGSVRGGSIIGGLAGNLFTDDSQIINSYSSGAVSGNTFVGGFLGRYNSGSITKSFWDTTTSGTGTGIGDGVNSEVIGGCFSNSCPNGGSANLSLLSTYTNAGWSVTSTSSVTPNGSIWFMAPSFIDNSGNITTATRPMLISEAFVNNSPLFIQNAHQLQLMAANLAGNYNLGANIDLTSSMTNEADVWATNYLTNPTPTGRAGFVPMGTGFNANPNDTYFSGSFNGNGLSIKNLYIYKHNSLAYESAGLFGNVALGSDSYIKNLSLIDVNIFAGSVIGGLIANMAYGSSGTISNVYVSGNVTQQTQGYNGVGGLIGVVIGANPTISNVYSTVHVTGVGTTGGLIGYLAGNGSASVKNSYSSGLVSNGIAVGGFIGTGGNFTSINNVWDVGTSGQSSGVSGSAAPFTNEGLLGGCFGSTSCFPSGFSTLTNASNTTTLYDLSLLATYTTTVGSFTGWGSAITASSSSSPSDATWFMVDGRTRPMLVSEEFINNQPLAITNPHQLQLMSANLGGNYSLGSNIDLTSSMSNRAEVWGTNNVSGKGWAPVGESIGGNRALEFRGTLKGNDYVINGLYIKDSSNVTPRGFFGAINGARIQDVHLTNIDVTTLASNTGGLIGWLDWQAALHTQYSVLNNVSATGNLTVNGNEGNIG